jgi:hypothetical protein
MKQKNENPFDPAAYPDLRNDQGDEGCDYNYFQRLLESSENISTAAPETISDVVPDQLLNKLADTLIINYNDKDVKDDAYNILMNLLPHHKEAKTLLPLALNAIQVGVASPETQGYSQRANGYGLLGLIATQSFEAAQEIIPILKKGLEDKHWFVCQETAAALAVLYPIQPSVADRDGLLKLLAIVEHGDLRFYADGSLQEAIHCNVDARAESLMRADVQAIKKAAKSRNAKKTNLGQFLNELVKAIYKKYPRLQNSAQRPAARMMAKQSRRPTA